MNDVHERMSKWEIENLGGKQAFSMAFNPLVGFLQIQSIRGKATKTVVSNLQVGGNRKNMQSMKPLDGYNRAGDRKRMTMHSSLLEALSQQDMDGSPYIQGGRRNHK